MILVVLPCVIGWWAGPDIVVVLEPFTKVARDTTCVSDTAVAQALHTPYVSIGQALYVSLSTCWLCCAGE
jgi:hypothetical protein